AKVGRASRLGERSKGFLDVGAVSSCLILESMADSIIRLLNNS
ncbi:MAG: DAK2 domain-containing protein, partial [Candidatus Atribacteria bacterium]|nr:DAK2 domain-containing protein [Candidatus Atribacteria bacterium]